MNNTHPEMHKWIEIEYKTIDMKLVTETLSKSKERNVFNGAWENLAIAPTWKHFHAEMHEILTSFAQRGFEIISVTPIAEGRSHEYSNTSYQTGSNHLGGMWGFGYGVGFGHGKSPTGAMVIVAQKIEYITKEEFQHRKKEEKRRENEEKRKILLQQAKKHDLSLQENLKSAKTILDEQTLAWQKSLKITEKKGIFGKPKYIVGKKKFDSKSDAQQYQKNQNDMLEKQKESYNTIKQKIQENSSKIEKLSKKLL